MKILGVAEHPADAVADAAASDGAEEGCKVRELRCLVG